MTRPPRPAHRPLLDNGLLLRLAVAGGIQRGRRARPPGEPRRRRRARSLAGLHRARRGPGGPGLCQPIDPGTRPSAPAERVPPRRVHRGHRGPGGHPVRAGARGRLPRDAARRARLGARRHRGGPARAPRGDVRTLGRASAGSPDRASPSGPRRMARRRRPRAAGYPPAMALVVDHLVKRFGPVVALDGMDFRVEPGQIFGFLGANGAGKTTTIRIVLDLLRPDSGTTSWHGHADRRPAPPDVGLPARGARPVPADDRPRPARVLRRPVRRRAAAMPSGRSASGSSACASPTPPSGGPTS